MCELGNSRYVISRFIRERQQHATSKDHVIAWFTRLDTIQTSCVMVTWSTVELWAGSLKISPFQVSEANLCSEKLFSYGKPLARRSYHGMAKFSVVVAPNRKTRFRSVELELLDANSTPRFIMKTHENYTWTIITIWLCCSIIHLSNTTPVGYSLCRLVDWLTDR